MIIIFYKKHQKGEIYMKEDIQDISEVFLGAKGKECKEKECCCPEIVIYIFKKVNCVNIFNGACEDWSPGGPCAESND